MIIALVRHGETDWNRQRRWQGRSDIPLNHVGREQAVSAAPVLAGRSWSWMLTSPLQRARETGALIAAELPPMPVDVDAELVEQDYGEADGMINTDAADRWPDGSFPGMESRSELRDRGIGAIQRIAAGRSGPGIVVAHGGLIRATIGGLCDIEVPRILNGAVSLIRRGPDRWHPVELNLVSELAPADAGATDRSAAAASVPIGDAR
jgi:uncharacterized phosphatase